MKILILGFLGLEVGQGTGHVYRIRLVAEALANKGWARENIIWITNASEPSEHCTIVKVKDKHTAVQAALGIIKSGQCDLVMFDCLDFCSEVYPTCNANNVISVGIDTHESDSELLDVLINPVIQNENSYLPGAFYSIFEKKIEYDGVRTESNNLDSICMCFGGIDFRRHFEGIRNYLKMLPRSVTVNIVVADKDELKSEILVPSNCKLHFRPANFLELLSSASFAVVSGGVILQTCMYLGIPSFVIPQYEHQLENARMALLEGRILGVAPLCPNFKEQISEITSLMKTQSLMRDVSLQARARDDGFGLERAVSILSVVDTLQWDSDFFNINISSLNTKSYTKSIKRFLDAHIQKIIRN